MIKAYASEGARLRAIDFQEKPEAAVWVDLFQPTEEEEDAVEKWFGIGVPTREEMDEIEISSRLYVDRARPT